MAFVAFCTASFRCACSLVPHALRLTASTLVKCITNKKRVSDIALKQKIRHSYLNSRLLPLTYLCGLTVKTACLWRGKMEGRLGSMVLYARAEPTSMA